MRASNVYGFKRFMHKVLDEFAGEQDVNEVSSYENWFERLFYFTEKKYEMLENTWRSYSNDM